MRRKLGRPKGGAEANGNLEEHRKSAQRNAGVGASGMSCSKGKRTKTLQRKPCVRRGE